MKNLVDFARLLDVCPDLDWDEVWRRAERTRSTRVVLFSLSTLQSLLRVELPACLRERLADGPSLPRTKCLPGKLLRESRDASGFEQLVSRFDLGDGMRDRVCSCLKMLIVPTARDWESLPGTRRSAWVYWLWRPLRLAGLSLVRILPRFTPYAAAARR